MYETAAILGLYAETPLHPGSGQSTGPIDLPIQRERHTEFPTYQATSLKGVLRDAARGVLQHDEIAAVFGPETGGGDLHGGALCPTDARLLLFPARSLDEVFIWATCPLIIERLRRDLKIAQDSTRLLPNLKVQKSYAWVSQNSALTNSPIVLEDDAYAQKPTSEVDELVKVISRFMPDGNTHEFFRQRLQTHLVVLNDADFAELTRKGTDVVTRIKLNKKKTTTGDGGNMWVEEHLPSDCLFYSVLLALNPRGSSVTVTNAAQVLEKAKKIIEARKLLQLGGDETVGRGWTRATWVEP